MIFGYGNGSCGACAVGGYGGSPSPQPPRFLAPRMIRTYGAVRPTIQMEEELIEAPCPEGSSWSVVDGRCHAALASSPSNLGILSLVALAVVGVIVFSKS